MEKNAAVLMADLTGYTAMTDAHGGASAAMLVNKYMELVEKALKGDTQIIQRVGDQVVLLADNSEDIVNTAIELHSLTLGEHQLLSIHAGMHYGPVFIDKGDLFGSTINIASRIMNKAEHGQILCSSDLVEKTNSAIHSFRSLGKFSFKNVMKEIMVYELVTDTKPETYIDPVCRMQIDPNRTEFIYQYKNHEYHFCSQHCLNLFLENQESYLAR